MSERFYKKIILLTDIAAMTLAYLMSIGMRGVEVDEDSPYLNALIIMILLYIVIYANYEYKQQSFFKRGYLIEYAVVFKTQMLLFFIWITYLFVTKQSDMYSRFVFVTFCILSIFTVYVTRCYQKMFAYILFHKTKSHRNCMVITIKGKVNDIVRNINKEWDIQLNGIIVIDEDMTGQMIDGVPVCGNSKNIMKAVMSQVVDEIYINVPSVTLDVKKDMILNFEKLGILVHINVDIFDVNAHNKKIDSFGTYNVVTFATNIYNVGGMVVKRILDILGSLVGLTIMAIAFIFVAPAIKLESPGPIFFAQKRVGKNGRVFSIYKFRSMYADAEARKAELMKQNEMQGFMFKMTDDPRITKVGKFIRKTSIDELPQFWNILKGDMSMVGTRPPTVDEVEQYEAWQRRRLSIRPGLTGLWQVSGRNEISDFDDVVKYDLEYIDNWSIILDLKLLVKTIFVVFKHNGK
jgi:exopolysaccharide biosynthesis polyprenyl glycosylphosphotransferase